jgi:dihydrofolate reductase
VIGAAGAIPWHVPGDLPRFKRLTKGHVLIMGRKTYESIGHPLPGRSTIVITRDPGWRADGVEAVDSVERAISRAEQIDPAGPIFVAGGGDIYRAALDRTDRLEITAVDQAPDGDATFPPIDTDRWAETARDDDHDGFAWITYTRRG